MKNRYELAKHFADQGYTVGAEIGVCKGYYSKVLCESIPDLKKLYGVDPWTNESGTHRERHHRGLSFNIASDQLKPWIDSGVYEMLRMTSADASKIFAFALDFVFIDGLHDYENVKFDINAWAPKVRSGGIVSGHDYYRSDSGRMGVIEAVDEYVKEHGLELHLTEWDNEQTRDNRQPCWWFVQP